MFSELAPPLFEGVINRFERRFGYLGECSPSVWDVHPAPVPQVYSCGRFTVFTSSQSTAAATLTLSFYLTYDFSLLFRGETFSFNIYHNWKCFC